MMPANRAGLRPMVPCERGLNRQAIDAFLVNGPRATNSPRKASCLVIDKAAMIKKCGRGEMVYLRNGLGGSTASTEADAARSYSGQIQITDPRKVERRVADKAPVIKKCGRGLYQE